MTVPHGRSNRRPKCLSMETGESKHLAHAASRVLLSLSPRQVERYGRDLVDLVEKEIPEAWLDCQLYTDESSPTALQRIAKTLARSRKRVTDLDRRLTWVCEALSFNEVDFAVLSVLARWSTFASWRQLVRDSPLVCDNLNIEALSLLSGQPGKAIIERLMPGSRLLGCGLVGDDRDGEYNCAGLLKRLSRLHMDKPEDLMRWLMPDGERSALEWQDFDHLGAMRDLAKNVLSSGQPTSILLYGEPGTGKSEFARVLAEKVGSGAVFAGLTDSVGFEPDRSDRLSHLLTLRVLCGGRNDKVIVVDEADDVLAIHRHKDASKQWINRLVETPQAPTIWIVNDPDNLDETVVRRMALAIGFSRPPLTVRQRIAHRAAEAHNLLLSPAEAQSIAALPANPAVVASGLRTAQMSGGGAAIAARAISSVMQAMGQSPSPERQGSAVYDPTLSTADIDLGHLANQLAGAPQRGWSLLLAGPSGTGKSAFARHLATSMGIEVEERRGADLLGSFVGDTERNIAGAFARAAERGAMLLIDEADSFLFRRESGQRSWEVGMVNEMLRQMECIRSPFVATTNLADKLDPAMQRRFTVRATFQTMTVFQARRLFHAQFGQDWPQGQPVPEGQTPGDFAVVSQRANLLGETRSEVILRWLRDEIQARGAGRGGPMGFRLPESVEPSCAIKGG